MYTLRLSNATRAFRIIALSDTHTHHDKVSVPDGDVLVFAGDISHFGKTAAPYAAFNTWLGKLPHAHKLVIAGNHDLYLEDEPVKARALLSHAQMLCDTAVVVHGVHFHGSPWTITGSAFYGETNAAMKRHWKKISAETDVLITHNPPLGVMDVGETGDLLGCRELRKQVLALAPCLHIFGHVHCRAGFETLGDTLCLNVAVAGEGYLPKNKPVVIDIRPA